MSTIGQCPCGKVQFAILGRPLFRMFCHCTICQRFSQADYADVTVFRGKHVGPAPEESVSFRTYRPPPNVLRGTCVSCGKPALDLARIPLFPRLTMVPTGNLVDEEYRLEPVFHAFYRHRVGDARDDLPKYAGYLSSQLAFTAAMLQAFTRSLRQPD